MFNLEESIAQWRRQMLAAGINSPVPLEELESHLREDWERQTRSGLSAQQAFEMAVAQMGQATALKHEFNKTKRNDMINHNRMYFAALATLTVCNAISTAVLLYWLAAVGGQLGKLSPRLLPWMTALSCAYTLAMIVTLLARQLRPQSGRRMTRFLNWALLPAFPCGTVIGSYGLWKVDKETA
jgi:hypothetical protein